MAVQTFPLDSSAATRLTDARLQVHHAAQFATAMGISFLPHERDDSHTNLGWVDEIGGLASHRIPAPRPFHLALRITDLALLLVDERDGIVDAFPLNGRAVAEAAAWIRTQVAARGADANRFTLDRHYSIPAHPVADGAAFDTSDAAAFDQLSRWFASASRILEEVRAGHSGEAVRCWPHHFDIATLLHVAGDATIGIGMEPGDVYYDEPYYYVNKHPQPPSPPAEPLAGNGQWHTREWIGAVLTGSHVNTADQRAQIQSFIKSAMASY